MVPSHSPVLQWIKQKNWESNHADYNFMSIYYFNYNKAISYLNFIVKDNNKYQPFELVVFFRVYFQSKGVQVEL